MAGAGVDTRMRSSDARTRRSAPGRPTDGLQGGTTMSASTRTIQQPLGLGSILRPLALAAVALLAAVVIGYMILTATAAKSASSTGSTIQPSAVWDRGSRFDVAPAPGTAPYADRGGRFDPVSHNAGLRAE